MMAGYLYGSLTQQRNALAGRHGLQAFLFLALAVYFVWFWSHGGQTVAMKTWHIRLVHADGMHLFFNMFTLFFFGGQMEAYLSLRIGVLGLPLLYVGGLVASILPSYVKHQNDPNYYSLGASGAVAAVLFAAVLLRPGATIYLFFIPMPALVFGIAYIAYSWYMDRQSNDNINHSAHLWGAGFGLMFMALLEPSLVGRLLH